MREVIESQEILILKHNCPKSDANVQTDEVCTEDVKASISAQSIKVNSVIKEEN